MGIQDKKIGMIDAGMRMGMERDTSLKISFQTIAGVLEMWRQCQIPLDRLLNESCTPGGVSEVIVLKLGKHGFQDAISDAIRNGAIKADQLGKTA